MKYEEAMIFIKDGIKFVQVFAGAINKSTPHLYLSALPFSPCKSVMAQYLVERFSRIAKVAVGKHDDWPKNQHVLQGHTSIVWSVAFSQDGRYIVSGSLDRTIQVWDAQTGDQVGNPLQGHTDSVLSVAFSQDGRHIVSGSSDGTIRVWDAQTLSTNSGNAGQRTKFTSVKFSSSAAYALHNAQCLFVDTSDATEGDSKDLVYLQADGWIVGPKGKLLLWVPPAYHTIYLYTPETNLVLPRGGPELDLSRMSHGPTWQQCYTSGPTMAT